MKKVFLYRNSVPTVTRAAIFPTLSFLFFLLFSFTVYGQAPQQVTIFQPLNGAFFESSQIRVDFIVSGTAPNFVRILVDDRPAQLLTEVAIGQNAAVVDLPARDCKISIVAVNEFGESVPAVVNLRRNEHIFKPTLHILAIGVSEYRDPDLRLQFAAKDAIDFALAMVQQQGLLYEKVEMRLLTDHQASADNIRGGLHWLRTETTFTDVAMIFMAGHGVNNNVGDFFFMPVNADMNMLEATCVSYSDIKRTIDAVAGKMLVFMDACHSGNVLGNTQRRATMVTQAISDLTGADNGAVVFTSSTGRQFSLENPEWNNGAFTKALVEGLNGAADLFGRQTITVNTLSSYITNRVRDLTAGQQAPTIIVPGSVSDFPLAVVNPNMPTDAETAATREEIVSRSNVVKTTLSAADASVFTALRRNIYSENTKLNKFEIRSAMRANSHELRLYEKGRRNRTFGMTFLTVGGGVIAYGIFDTMNYYNLTGFDRTSATIYSSGIAAAATGMICMFRSKNQIRNSVNTYNNTMTTAGIEFDFGITGNGVGLAVRF